MNGRQAARAAAGRIAELEYVNTMQARDIKDYNAVIQHMIEGNSPCDYCEECNECQLEAKGGKGCTEWWLRYPEEGSATNAGECGREEAVQEG